MVQNSQMLKLIPHYKLAVQCIESALCLMGVVAKACLSELRGVVIYHLLQHRVWLRRVILAGVLYLVIFVLGILEWTWLYLAFARLASFYDDGPAMPD